MTDFTFKNTARGFGIIDMPGRDGEVFRLQESSAMDAEQSVWFGASELRVKSFLNGQWSDVDFDALLPGARILGNERMHLSQSQVRALLPILRYFVREGTLPNALSDVGVGVHEDVQKAIRIGHNLAEKLIQSGYGDSSGPGRLSSHLLSALDNLSMGETLPTTKTAWETGYETGFNHGKGDDGLGFQKGNGYEPIFEEFAPEDWLNVTFGRQHFEPKRESDVVPGTETSTSGCDDRLIRDVARKYLGASMCACDDWDCPTCFPLLVSPCPFCGGEATSGSGVFEDGEDYHEIRCENTSCGVQPSVRMSSAEAAQAAWNRRPASA